MKVLDLFAGLGGFSQAFKDRGHEVHTLDNDPQFHCTFIMDVRDGIPAGGYDVILASPPCNEFAPWGMPPSWHPNRKIPDLSLIYATLKIIDRLKPRWWVIENVRGSVKFLKPILGKPVIRGFQYLWGEFPLIPKFKPTGKGKELLSPSKERAALRSLIPYNLSLALCIAMENEYPK